MSLIFRETSIIAHKITHNRFNSLKLKAVLKIYIHLIMHDILLIAVIL